MSESEKKRKEINKSLRFTLLFSFVNCLYSIFFFQKLRCLSIDAPCILNECFIWFHGFKLLNHEREWMSLGMKNIKNKSTKFFKNVTLISLFSEWILCVVFLLGCCASICKFSLLEKWTCDWSSFLSKFMSPCCDCLFTIFCWVLDFFRFRRATLTVLDLHWSFQRNFA